MAREGLDVGGTGRTKSESRSVAEGRDGGGPRRAVRKTKKRVERLATGGNQGQQGVIRSKGEGRTMREGAAAQTIEGFSRSVAKFFTGDGRNPSGFSGSTGQGTKLFLDNVAGPLGLKRTDPLNNPGDPRGLPPEGRDDNALGRTRTRLRRIAGAGDSPVSDVPLTGAADEDTGEGSELIRKKRSTLGAANVRKPMLTAGLGATFLGRAGRLTGRTILGI